MSILPAFAGLAAFAAASLVYALLRWLAAPGPGEPYRPCSCYWCSARRELDARAGRGPGRLRARVGHAVSRVAGRVHAGSAR